MDVILEKHLVRKLTLLTLLQQQDLSLTAVMQRIVCCKFILLQDISEINELSQIIEINNNNVQLVKTHQVDVEYIRQCLIKQSSAIMLLATVLEGEPSVKSVAECCYTSESWVRSIIRKWNAYFHRRKLPFRLILSHSQIKMMGVERAVRQFYQKLLKLVAITDISTQKLEQESLYSEFFRNVSSSSDIQLGEGEVASAYFFLVAAAIRLRQGHFDDCDNIYYEEAAYRKWLGYAFFRRVLNHHFQMFMTDEMMAQLLPRYFLCGIMPVADFKVSDKLRGALVSLIDEFAERQRLAQLPEAAKLAAVTVLGWHYLYKRDVLYVVDDCSEQRLREWQTHFPWYEIVEELLERNSLLLETSEQQRYFMLAYIDELNRNFQLEYRLIEVKKVLIHASFPHYKQRQLQALIEAYYGKRVCVKIVESGKEVLQRTDFIITNYQLNNKDAKQILIYPRLVTHEWLLRLNSIL